MEDNLIEQLLVFYNNIRKSDCFFHHYQVSIESFDELVEILRPHITKMFRNSINVKRD